MKTENVSKPALLAAITAASSFMADKDIRHYLTGVMLDFDKDNCIDMVATDGTVMLALVVHAPNDIKGQYILPATDVKKILKLFTKSDKEPVLRFEVAPENFADDIVITDGKLSYAMTRIDGKFPDWTLAMPKEDREDTASNEAKVEPIGLKLPYLTKVSKALALVATKKYEGTRLYIHNAKSSILFTTPSGFPDLSDIRGVIMPMRL